MNSKQVTLMLKMKMIDVPHDQESPPAIGKIMTDLQKSINSHKDKVILLHCINY